MVPTSETIGLSVSNGRVQPRPHDREQRRHVRRPCDRWVGVVTVHPDGRTSPVITARAEDISAGGLGLYAWQTLGGRAAVLIPRSGGDPAIIGAEVVYCRGRSRLDYDCGLRFAPPAAGITIDDFREADGRLVDLGVVDDPVTRRAA